MTLANSHTCFRFTGDVAYPGYAVHEQQALPMVHDTEYAALFIVIAVMCLVCAVVAFVIGGVGGFLAGRVIAGTPSKKSKSYELVPAPLQDDAV